MKYSFPVETGRKLNVNKTFSLRPVSMRLRRGRGWTFPIFEKSGGFQKFFLHRGEVFRKVGLTFKRWG